MNYPVEKGIPLPPKSKTGPRTRYPFEEMQVGDSFLVPDGKAKNRALAIAMTRAGKMLGTQYTQRQVSDGVRVWRIA